MTIGKRPACKLGLFALLLLLTQLARPAPPVSSPAAATAAEPPAGESRSAIVTLLQALGENATQEQWAEAVLLLADPTHRHRTRQQLQRQERWARPGLVALLRHPRLAVRTGALDVLEEWSGSDLGFDPWADRHAPDNAKALAGWEAWSTGETPADSQRYEPLTEEQVHRYVEELLHGSEARSGRARAMLLHGGRAVAVMLDRYHRANPALSQEQRDQVREAAYASRLAPLGPAAVELARELVFGSLDARVEAIRRLATLPGDRLPILREMLQSPYAIVREGTVETLARVGDLWSIPILAEHVVQETDRDVVFAVLRSLGKVRSKRGLALLSSYLDNPDEDLVLAALGSISRLRTELSKEAIQACLRDRRWRVRAAAAEAISELDFRDEDVQEDLEGLLEDADPFVRVCAVKAFGGLGERKALPKLEEIFHRHDALKPVVLHVVGAMNVPLPKSFQSVCEVRDPELLLTVIRALEECGKAESILYRLAAHESDDVACAALRLVAGEMPKNKEHRGELLKVLQGQNRQRVLAALSGLRESYSFGRAPAQYGDMAVLETLLGAESASTAVTTGQPDALQALFDGFGVSGGAATAAATEPAGNAPGTQHGKTDSLTDLFTAFVGPEPAPGDRPESPGHEVGTGQDDLAAALRVWLERGDREVRDAAAMLLHRQGDAAASSYLDSRFQDMPVEVRQIVISETGIGHDERPGPRQETPSRLVGKGLRDPSADVRSAAVRTFLSVTKKGEPVKTITDMLQEEHAVLQAEDVWQGVPVHTVRPGRAARKQWQEAVARFLQQRERRDLRVLGVLLCTKLSLPGCKETLLAQADADDPYVRRAAYSGLMRLFPVTFWGVASKLAADPAEQVRAILPLRLMRRSRWYELFSPERKAQDWLSSSAREKLWHKDVKSALEALTQDASAHVRFHAKLVLQIQGVPCEPAGLQSDLAALRERGGAARLLYEAMVDHPKRFGKEFWIFVPEMERHGLSGGLDRLFRQSGEGGLVTAGMITEDFLPREAPEVSDAAAALSPATADEAVVLAYFDRPGCPECAAVRRWLSELQRAYPDLALRVFDIGKTDAVELNEALSARFGVPESLRLVAPSVFGAAGALTKGDISPSALEQLAERSRQVGSTAWLTVSPEESTQSGRRIEERVQSFRLALVLGAGLIDGVNPCAIAVIVFLLSYLQVMRRSGSQILLIGSAYIAGVYLTYLGIGLGLLEVLQRLAAVPWGAVAVRWGVAGFAAVLAAMSLRDAVLCFRGRADAMTLQLPGTLKAMSRGAIRRGMRSSHWVLAAFVMGAAVSVFELACTGQVYAPAIGYMVREGQDRAQAVGLLALYNAAFVAPLAGIFALSFLGLRSERLGELLLRHAGTAKVALAILFAAMAAAVVLA